MQSAAHNPWMSALMRRCCDVRVQHLQAIKSEAVWYRRSHDLTDVASTYIRMRKLDVYHGVPSGMYQVRWNPSVSTPAAFNTQRRWPRKSGTSLTAVRDAGPSGCTAAAPFPPSSRTAFSPQLSDHPPAGG